MSEANLTNESLLITKSGEKKASYTAKRHLPGEEGAWIFIVGDMMVFGLFFIVYLYHRGYAVSSFSDSQELLNQHYGALNTLLLLSSSWFIVMAINAVRKNKGSEAQRLILMGIFCGIGFIFIKILEYAEKIRDGYYLTTNDFFMFYYALTGAHFLHYLGGMGALIYIYVKCAEEQVDGRFFGTVEAVALYWHMVDLLWIFIFPLLYLLGAG